MTASCQLRPDPDGPAVVPSAGIVEETSADMPAHTGPPKTDPKALARRIRETRIAAGFDSMERLAQEAKVSTRHLARIESGEVGDTASMRKVLRFLGIQSPWEASATERAEPSVGPTTRDQLYGRIFQLSGDDARAIVALVASMRWEMYGEPPEIATTLLREASAPADATLEWWISRYIDLRDKMLRK